MPRQILAIIVLLDISAPSAAKINTAVYGLAPLGDVAAHAEHIPGPKKIVIIVAQRAHTAPRDPAMYPVVKYKLVRDLMALGATLNLNLQYIGGVKSISNGTQKHPGDYKKN